MCVQDGEKRVYDDFKLEFINFIDLYDAAAPYHFSFASSHFFLAHLSFF